MPEVWPKIISKQARIFIAKAGMPCFAAAAMSSTSFTIEDGLAIQRTQLDAWKSKLNAECYSSLLLHVLKENAKLTAKSTGHDVTRGTDLDRFISNWKA